LHKVKPLVFEEDNGYAETNTPGAVDVESATVVTKLRTSSIKSVVSVADAEGADEETNRLDYSSPGAYMKVAVLRIIVIAILVVISIALRNKFLDLQDFVGASSMSISCMILPMVFYLKVFYTKIGMAEKIFCVVSILICSFLAVYVSYTTGKNLFAPDPTDPNLVFPFCPVEYETYVYTNTTHYGTSQ